jgi:hypothetical protein
MITLRQNCHPERSEGSAVDASIEPRDVNQGASMKAIIMTSRIVGLGIGCLVLCCLLARNADACFQFAPTPIVIKASSLNGRATKDDKPWKSLGVSLYRAITFNRVEARKTGAWEKPAIKSIETGSDGLFSFGEVPPGRYWVVPQTGSVGFPVEVQSLDSTAYKRLWYNFFADGCETLAIENTH